jgi:D-glycero-D-manno-heptose 1,7-bisphosphate phosphatase
VFVVTNQSGVARGYYEEKDVQRFHARMQRELAACGARIDAFRYCPHHPEGSRPPYALSCLCRKPKPGMIVELLESWPVDRHRSFVVGDKSSDLAAARAAGLRGVLFDGSCLLAQIRSGIQETARTGPDG